MKKAISIVLAAMLLLGLLVGCGGGTGESGNSSGNPSGPVNPADTTIAVCMGTINHPVHRVVQMAFVTEGKKLGYNAIVAGLDEGSTQELIAKFESTITNGARGCLIWTGDDSAYEMMRDLTNMCVFVVPHFAHEFQDTKSFISRNICAQAKAYGTASAEFMLERLAAKGKTRGTIGITQSGANITENAAADAFKATIDASGTNFKCAKVVYEGLELAAAATKVTGVIQANSDIVGGFGTTGGSAQAWYTAMENTETYDLVVIGMDYTEYNQDLVAEKKITAIVAQPLYEEAQESVNTLDAILTKGEVFNDTEENWYLHLDAPLAYAGGEGLHDIEHYRPIIDAVIEYFSD